MQPSLSHLANQLLLQVCVQLSSLLLNDLLGEVCGTDLLCDTSCFVILHVGVSGQERGVRVVEQSWHGSIMKYV